MYISSSSSSSVTSYAMINLFRTRRIGQDHYMRTGSLCTDYVHGLATVLALRRLPPFCKYQRPDTCCWIFARMHLISTVFVKFSNLVSPVEMLLASPANIAVFCIFLLLLSDAVVIKHPWSVCKYQWSGFYCWVLARRPSNIFKHSVRVIWIINHEQSCLIIGK